MQDQPRAEHRMNGHPYVAFAVNMILSLVAMYVVMFSMIDGWIDFRNNLNMLYMALTMVAPMGVLMIVTMKGMYPKRTLNVLLIAGFVILFISGFAAIRTQALIGDRQFIASMIPHHSGAVLMCRKAALTDPELTTLCAQIARGQRAEIEQMNAIRTRLGSD
ncbi:DUF305 domain-containing protein [Shinella sp. 838]|uniref:DUF305 domain-containing protein n=1 Tax=unclassified Shinella TaxID=2643062 RepID=UPI000437BAC0|nr:MULTISPECIES: DUF305 domain-containing protein [unclassified Shinella]EYR80975.1 hypothetical protein SHLA_54c000030 [Shinella sp. DD12]MCA0338116.1 DUF305 domain-containing protein [Pseudomonadota bacterium]MDG4675446.1 DUF305 domain-containing protein [Shinella sp. 838]